MTTAVTDLSEQKKVLERRAYCSENLHIISTDFCSDESTAPPSPAAAKHGKNRFFQIQMVWFGIGIGIWIWIWIWGVWLREESVTLGSDGTSASVPSAPGDGRRAERGPDGGGDGHHRWWPWVGRVGKGGGERDNARQEADTRGGGDGLRKG